MTTHNREDVSFPTLDGTILRGWFYPTTNGAPSIIITHGFTCLKEHGLDLVAAGFQSAGIAALVYDQRNLGASSGTPRFEVHPSYQSLDIHDAVAYLLQRPEQLDPRRLCVWGYSLSGHNAIKAGALDRRIAAVVAVAPVVRGRDMLNAYVPLRAQRTFHEEVWADQTARLAGQEPTYVPVVAAEEGARCALPSTVGYQFFTQMKARGVAPAWENRVSLQSVAALFACSAEPYLRDLAPTPLLMVLGQKDDLTLPESMAAGYELARQPKEVLVLDGDHFDMLKDGFVDEVMAASVDFLKRRLNIGTKLSKFL